MKTFKNIQALEKRLKKGIDWGDWIKIARKVYKMVEYGDGENGNYMSFQNKKTTDMIQVNYQVPCFKWIGEGKKKERIQTHFYQFHNIEQLGRLGYLYRY